MNFSLYDYFIVAFSGGKDSLACVLHLLEQGVPKEKISLWHHDIDGREGSELMDWPITKDYCRKVAEYLGIPIRFSWKEGGFEREMLRSNSLTAQVFFEDVDGKITACPVGTPRKRKKPCGVCGSLDCLGCRQKFPQVTADLSQRWCTSYLKIDVGCKALSNQKTFDGKRTLFVTGERALESYPCGTSLEKALESGKGRAGYAELEPHKRHAKKRHIDHHRPVHKWTEKQVWDIIERHHIKAHPCYYLGWGRCSCAACIFGNDNQWASLNEVAPRMIKKICGYEDKFGVTIHRTKKVVERLQSGEPYRAADPDCHEGRLVMSREFTDSVWMPDWKLPAGAFGDNTGPI